jgi:hypothetical protein
MTKTEFPQSKKYIRPDGTVMYLWDSKLHNWDGPALIPEGENKHREYYLYGIKYDEKEWKFRKKQLTGLPFYKMAGTKMR